MSTDNNTNTLPFTLRLKIARFKRAARALPPIDIPKRFKEAALKAGHKFN